MTTSADITAMTIAGRPTYGDSATPVVNPATEEVVGHAPACSAEQLDQAVRAAADASPAWAEDDAGRRAALGDAVVRLAHNQDELAAMITAEQGKPLSEAVEEVEASIEILDFYTRVAMPPQVLQDDNEARIEVVRYPLGVVAAITPWNYPLLLAIAKLGPALAAGNTIVLKPSPFTPLTALRLGEILASSLPAGVVNVVSGSDALGAELVAHPVPAKVSFTGSIEAGRDVGARAGWALKRVTLELGGNDPAIVLDDADVDAVAERIFWAAFENCGQVCAAVKRVYAPARLHDRLVDALCDLARHTVVGNGAEPDVRLGPLNNTAQLGRVTELVAECADSARVMTGGTPIPDVGYFHPPTIVTDVDHSARLVQEEQFGPALPIISYADLDDAIQMANSTEYGLSASVWGTDVDRAERVGTRLQCGTVWVNAHHIVPPHQPFGGAKSSGIGVDSGHEGLLSYTQLQVKHIPGRP